uniref:Putative head tail connector protein n=1 Tax=viral metagenome TaxID=1070528 RepID=A0A6M3K5G4_9ZZZZ
MPQSKMQVAKPSKPQAEEKIEQYQKLKGLRSNFESYWQTLHDYFYVESPNINASQHPGSELNFNNLWDSTTLEASDVLASGFMNYLTPPTSKWFRLKPSDIRLVSNKAVSSYLEDVADEVNDAINKSNFYNEVISSYKSSGVYGTSILMEEEDIEDDIRFSNLPIKSVCIVEDTRGKVVEYYIEFEYTAFQAMTRWGIDKLSTPMKEEVKSRTDKKHLFLLFIGRRYKKDVTKENKENMDIEALWIDVKGKRIMDEGGYNEFPAMTHRFDKRPMISWGFSPAMKALPMARLLNAIAKTNLRAMMKQTDPPLALPENAFIMPFNANPRAINYYKKTALDSGKDIFPFGNYGNVNVGMEALEYYSLKVRSLMYNDVFLAFDNITKQMNNPEVMERINEKMTMLGPAVGRYTSEILDPIIIRTIGILWRRGRLPDPPDELLENPSYQIDYVSQLAQSQKRSEMNALVSALSVTGQIAQFAPESLDKINADKTVDSIWDVTGAPIRVLRDDLEIQAIRENRVQQAQAAQQMAMLQQGVDVVDKGAGVDKKLAEAKAVGAK